MKKILVHIFLALSWLLLSPGSLTSSNFLLGIAVGFLIISLFGFIKRDFSYPIKWIIFIRFSLFVFWDILVSNIRVAREVLTPKALCRPGIIAIPILFRNPVEITVLASIISITPGTLTLDVSSDRRHLYMHTMFIDDIDKIKKEIIKQYETRLIRLFEA